jgi:hypothetical protein
MNRMNSYYTNIRYQRYDAVRKGYRTQRIVSSAYVLYPGNRVYEEADGNVGGIPLRPNMSDKLQQAAREKLHALLNEAGII